MKRMIIVSAVFAALLSLTSCDKYEDGIPQKSIRDDFNSKYPDAKDVEWDREGAYWVVSFEIGVWPDIEEYEVWYDSSGEVVDVKRDR